MKNAIVLSLQFLLDISVKLNIFPNILDILRPLNSCDVTIIKFIFIIWYAKLEMINRLIQQINAQPKYSLRQKYHLFISDNNIGVRVDQILKLLWHSREEDYTFSETDIFFSRFNQCFGVLGILDLLHGTDDRYRDSKHFLRDFVSFSFTPVREIVPDDDCSEN